MIRNKLILKFISLFLLIQFTSSLIFPSISYALTSGPTAPEYSSFEPIDTTDMVNISTGDFVYNMPLLEVPGPEGGYPINLAYHAGIKNEQESSWVGLGWNINMGAINRIVNGYPDDFNGLSEVLHDTWEGGQTNTYSIGLGYSGAYAGLNFANDTYKGFGVGFSAGIGIPLGEASPISAGAGVSVGPYGGGAVTLGLNASTPADGLRASGGVGLMYSFDQNSKGELSVYSSVGISYQEGGSRANFSLLGASISSSNLTPRASAVGISINSINDNSGNLSYTRSSFGIVVPIFNTGAYLSLAKSTTRYYLDQIDSDNKIFGSLYRNKVPNNEENLRMDSYNIIDSDYNYDGLSTDPAQSMGGALMASDYYYVLGQGIAGSISPQLHKDPYVFRADVRDKYNYSKAQYLYNNSEIDKISYAFDNEFSNALIKDVNTDFSTQTKIGKNNQSFDNNSNYYNNTDEKLLTAKSVEWFTNKDINQGIAKNEGLITYDIPTNRITFFEAGSIATNIESHIGGFKITNETGMTYHYTLPVYSFRNFDKSVNDDPINGSSERTTMLSAPYAYTWLLTAITGPDFVDRSYGNNPSVPDGNIGDTDWGYWVKFEYGKWTDKYLWRNPAEGYNKDLNSEIESYAIGQKELYYLDAIRTRSHTALFIKDIKRDGKSVKYSPYFNPEDVNSAIQGYGVSTDTDGRLQSVSVSGLKLNQIALFNNLELKNKLVALSDAEAFEHTDIRNNSNFLDASFQFKDYQGTLSELIKIHNAGNVIDKYDFQFRNLDKLLLSAERVINFDYSYELATNTNNSIDINYSSSPSPSLIASNLGRLTLNKIEFKAKNNSNVLPPVSFDYYFKNIEYDKYKYDIWGNYKSDGVNNDNITRYTTSASSMYSKAWSLKTINTSLGANIEVDYEADTYNKVLYNGDRVLNISSLKTLANSGQIEITVDNLSENLNFLNDLSIGNKVDINCILKVYKSYTISNNDLLFCESETEKKYYQSSNNDIIDINISSNKIKILSNSLYNSLTDNSNLAEKRNCCNISNGTCYIINGSKIGNNWSVLSGNFKLMNNSSNRLGGGLRVSNIKFNSDGVTNITNFSYSNGFTTYEPLIYKFITNENINGLGGDYFVSKNQFERKNFIPFVEISEVQGIIPGPGVIYQNVVVTESTKHGTTNFEVNGKVEYEFLTLNNDLKKLFRSAETNTNNNQINRLITLRDFSSRLGVLKSIKNLNKNNHLLSKQEFFYFGENLNEHNFNDYVANLNNFFYNQGRRDEVYKEFKLYNLLQTHHVVTEVERHPLIPIKKISTVYRDNEISYKNEIKTLAYNYFTGEASHLYSTDPYGNAFMAEAINAFEVYPEMGLATQNSLYKNMLQQIAVSNLFKVNPNNTDIFKPTDLTKTGIINSQVQTWAKNIPNYNNFDNCLSVGYNSNNFSNSYMMNQTYVWDGNNSSATKEGLIPIANFNSYNFTNTSANVGWKLLSEVTKKDVYSKPVEIKDINNNFTSTLYSPDHLFSTVSASFCKMNELAYSGAEFINGTINNCKEGNIDRGEGLPVAGTAHTGLYSLFLEPNKKGFIFNLTTPEANKKYFASVWVYLPGFTDDNTNLNNVLLVAEQNGSVIASAGRVVKQKAGSWHLLQLQFSGTNSSTISVYCKNNTSSFANQRAVYFDDMRVHPLQSQVSSYVYDRTNSKLTHVLNNDNFYTRFEYDDVGKVKATYQELLAPTEKLVTTNQYNYGKQ